RKKLSKLVDLWVKGLELDWNKFYTDSSLGVVKPKRISLPTYPFAKERYWIDVPTSGSLQTTRTVANILHPLLHTNTSDLWQQSYCTTFNGAENFLKNSSNGLKTLPAAVYLEMARAALDVASPVKHESTTIEFHNTVWGHACEINGNTQLSVALLPKNSNGNQDQQIDFEFYSKNEQTSYSDEDVIHCQGHAVLSRLPAPPGLDVKSIRAQMVRAQMIEDGAGNIKVDTTDTLISDLYLGNQQLLAELKLSSLDANDVNQGNNTSSYILHPQLMDSALRLSRTLAGEQNVTLASLESMRVIFACKSQMLVWVRNSLTASTAGLTVDIDLCDLDGNICVQMRGLHYQHESLPLGEAKGITVIQSAKNISGVAVASPKITTEAVSQKP
ncbi:MAG: hypothetical protein EOO68_35405, partial [Moraxellaceae bacterium]